jgi:hypothetical protein
VISDSACDVDSGHDTSVSIAAGEVSVTNEFLCGQ